MRCESLKQLYDMIFNKISNYKIVLNEDNLIIENHINHVIKIVYHFGSFNVYIDDCYYHDVDKFDIEETIETIIKDYILLKNKTAHILSLKERDEVIKKDKNAYIFKFDDD